MMNTRRQFLRDVWVATGGGLLGSAATMLKGRLTPGRNGREPAPHNSDSTAPPDSVTTPSSNPLVALSLASLQRDARDALSRRAGLLPDEVARIGRLSQVNGLIVTGIRRSTETRAVCGGTVRERTEDGRQFIESVADVHEHAYALVWRPVFPSTRG